MPFLLHFPLFCLSLLQPFLAVVVCYKCRIQYWSWDFRASTDNFTMIQSLWLPGVFGCAYSQIWMSQTLFVFLSVAFLDYRSLLSKFNKTGVGQLLLWHKNMSPACYSDSSTGLPFSSVFAILVSESFLVSNVGWQNLQRFHLLCGVPYLVYHRWIRRFDKYSTFKRCVDLAH